MTTTLLLLAFLSWLLGSLPTAFIVGKSNGVDLRTVGSGNLGATNVFRELGWKWALFVYLADAAKGMLPVVLFPRLAGVSGGWPWGVLFGVAAIVGHVRPVFLGFRAGGKGVATASGVFFALTPIAGLIALAVFITTVATTRYVSLGSLLGAVTLPVAVALFQSRSMHMLAVSVVVSVFVFVTHRENIGRLLRGEERRLTLGAHTSVVSPDGSPKMKGSEE